MSDPDRPITAGELAPLLQALERLCNESATALQALLDQGHANSLICALLVREMTKARLIDPDAIRTEALTLAERFEPLGPSEGVAKIVASIFGGEPEKISAPVALRVIQGGLDRVRRSQDPKPDDA